jgi:hypothetical protein
MAQKQRPEDDILWKMLASELAIEDVAELRAYLEGIGAHFEMGYGPLMIEPYDGRGGRSAMFRVRHDRLGETLVNSSTLKSVLHDLHHHLLR